MFGAGPPPLRVLATGSANDTPRFAFCDAVPPPPGVMGDAGCRPFGVGIRVDTVPVPVLDGARSADEGRFIIETGVMPPAVTGAIVAAAGAGAVVGVVSVLPVVIGASGGSGLRNEPRAAPIEGPRDAAAAAPALSTGAPFSGAVPFSARFAAGAGEAVSLPVRCGVPPPAAAGATRLCRKPLRAGEAVLPAALVVL